MNNFALELNYYIFWAFPLSKIWIIKEFHLRKWQFSQDNLYSSSSFLDSIYCGLIHICRLPKSFFISRFDLSTVLKRIFFLKLKQRKWKKESKVRKTFSLHKPTENSPTLNARNRFSIHKAAESNKIKLKGKKIC